MKMKKLILIGGVVVLVIIALILVIGISNIDSLIKNAVNTYGPDITKTAVRVEDVSISICSGEAKLKGFYLGNPRGFKMPEAISVGAIFVDVEERSLNKDTIIIDRIEVIRPEITYEKAKCTDNFRTIIDNVKKTTGADKSPKGNTEKGEEGKKLLIRDFIVKDGKVTLVTSLLVDKPISTTLPDIHLKNIGGEREGISPDKAFKEILTAVYGTITSNAVTDPLNKELNVLGTCLEEAGRGAKEELERVSDKLKGLFEK